MRFAADHAFRIGNQHLRGGLPCQDYALSGTFPGGAFAVVSDGCSSAGHTDVGARIVALTAAAAARIRVPIPLHLLETKWASPPFGLARDDLLATCVWATAADDGVAAGIMGDGVVAVGYKSGDVCVDRLEWANNAPAYPAYTVDGFTSFAAAQGGFDAEAATATCFRAHADGSITGLRERSLQLNFIANGNYVIWWPLTSVSFVAVFSDGVAQIDGVDWKAAVLDLLSFKTTAGAFARRRMHRFVEDVSKVGKGPLDDVAFAAILLEDD